ncbi:MAG: ATP-binding cassette domain-containing protein [Clostridiales bacterium]|nr:ATP-binding cassette domain-containing protein [Clostridiales bacterium]
MGEIFVKVENVDVLYKDKPALHDVNIDVSKDAIYSFIGPSGCGKTTLLRSINRMNDEIPGFRLYGKIFVDGNSVYEMKKQKEIRLLRKGIGMIFQRPNLLPKTVMQNMFFPYEEHYHVNKRELAELAGEKLRIVGLADELKGRLHSPAQKLSGGQQQRLCIARALMLDTKLLLLDEPCSSLDPISTYQIEGLLTELKASRTIVIVTHNMEQSRRISDFTAFFHEGRIIEKGSAMQIFSHPTEELTQRYIRGDI